MRRHGASWFLANIFVSIDGIKYLSKSPICFYLFSLSSSVHAILVIWVVWLFVLCCGLEFSSRSNNLIFCDGDCISNDRSVEFSSNVRRVEFALLFISSWLRQSKVVGMWFQFIFLLLLFAFDWIRVFFCWSKFVIVLIKFYQI